MHRIRNIRRCFSMDNEEKNKKYKEDKDTKHKKNNKSKVIINEENEDEQNEEDNSRGLSKEVANLKEVGVMSVAKADDRIQVIPIVLVTRLSLLNMS